MIDYSCFPRILLLMLSLANIFTFPLTDHDKNAIYMIKTFKSFDYTVVSLKKKKIPDTRQVHFFSIVNRATIGTQRDSGSMEKRERVTQVFAISSAYSNAVLGYLSSSGRIYMFAKSSEVHCPDFGLATSLCFFHFTN